MAIVGVYTTRGLVVVILAQVTRCSGKPSRESCVQSRTRLKCPCPKDRRGKVVKGGVRGVFELSSLDLER